MSKSNSKKKRKKKFLVLFLGVIALIVLLMPVLSPILFTDATPRGALLLCDHFGTRSSYGAIQYVLV